MSTISISDLEFITRESLASTFTPSSPSPSAAPTTTSNNSEKKTKRHLPSTTAIIDVRDSDHVGGHIRGSTWVPSSTLDYKMPELLRTLRNKETVVFHCALSQQRGPSAALRYLREKERLGVGSGVLSKGKVGEEGDGGLGEEGVDKEGVDKEEGDSKKQKVLVLQGGFTMWQEKYGEDEELTEGYKKDIWAFGS